MTEEEELEKLLKSRYWRLNNLYWIMDDHGKRVKFNINPVQYLLYKALWWLNVILKSRQHGITTFVCLFFLDACLFTPNIRAGIIAHKLADAKKIFRDKVKYAYDNLDEALKIEGKLNLLKDETMELVFANNSGISVGTSMRSGTLQYVLVSEYGWICQHAAQKAREIKAGALETVHEGGYIFVESTAEGVGDDFQHMCMAAEHKKANDIKLTRLDYQFHFFPWYIKPENQLFDEVEIPDHFVKYFEKIERVSGDTIGPSYRNWYVKKKETLRELMYKEHPSTSEEAFYASIEGTILGRYMIRAKEDNRIDFVPHDPHYPVYTASDLGDMHTAWGFFQFIRNRINVIDFYEDNSGLGPEDYAKVLTTKPYVYSGHVTGPDILGSNRKSTQTSKMTIDIYAELGIHFDVLEPHTKEIRIGASRGIIDRCWFDDRRCSILVKHMMNYHKEKDEIASTEDHTVYKEEPVHDAACHAADMFGHLALWTRICEENGTVPGGTTKSLAHKDSGTYDSDAAGITENKMMEV